LQPEIFEWLNPSSTSSPGCSTDLLSTFSLFALKLAGAPHSLPSCLLCLPSPSQSGAEADSVPGSPGLLKQPHLVAARTAASTDRYVHRNLRLSRSSVTPELQHLQIHSALSLPSFITAVQERKQKGTMALQMRSSVSAVAGSRPSSTRGFLGKRVSRAANGCKVVMRAGSWLPGADAPAYLTDDIPGYAAWHRAWLPSKDLAGQGDKTPMSCHSVNVGLRLLCWNWGREIR